MPMKKGFQKFNEIARKNYIWVSASFLHSKKFTFILRFSKKFEVSSYMNGTLLSLDHQ